MNVGSEAPLPTDSGFNLNPTPQPGTGAFGSVPGPIGMPPNTWQQLQGLYPNISGQLGQAAGNIGSELAGEVDMPSIARETAAYGIGSGMPGSGFSGTRGTNMTINQQQAMKRQGLQDYMGLMGSLGGMQTNQNTAIGVADRNSVYGAAPNPGEAYQKMLSDYLSMRNNPAGGTGGSGRGGGGSGMDPGMANLLAMMNKPSSPAGYTPAGTPTYNPNRTPPDQYGGDFSGVGDPYGFDDVGGDYSGGGDFSGVGDPYGFDDFGSDY